MAHRFFNEKALAVAAPFDLANELEARLPLRHATGYKLALEGTSMRTIQHYIGHRRIASTEIYTEHAPTDFRGLFK